MQENDWVSEGWKQAIKRVNKVGARRAGQGVKNKWQAPCLLRAHFTSL